MASKKNAKSKGYRNYSSSSKEKKAAQETRTMIIGMIIFVVVIICFYAGMKIYDNYGVLKVKDGVIQAENHWVVKNVNDQSDPKTYKMAEIIAPVEGFIAKEVDFDVRTAQINRYYTEDENAKVKEYYVCVANGNPVELANETVGDVIFGESINQSEVKTGKIAGRDAAYYTMDYYLEMKEPEKEYISSMNAYFESEFDGFCILVSVGDTVADENSFHTEEELMELMEKVVANLKICKKGQ